MSKEEYYESEHYYETWSGPDLPQHRVSIKGPSPSDDPKKTPKTPPWCNVTCVLFSLLISLATLGLGLMIGILSSHGGDVCSNGKDFQHRMAVSDDLCPGPEWTFVPKMAACYLFKKDRLNSSDADRACHEYGELVHRVISIVSDEEKIRIQRLLPIELVSKVIMKINNHELNVTILCIDWGSKSV